MRAWSFLSCVVGVMSIGCAAGKSTGASSTGGGSVGVGVTSSASNGPSSGTFGSTASATSTSGGACAKFTAQGKQESAAMLIVLARNASMTTNNKWPTAQQAVVAAIDQDAFDSISLGLVSFPQSFVTAPQCLTQFGVSQVSCGIGGLPEVPIAPAGSSKSNASSGVRHDIYQFLVNHPPLSNQDNGTPIYDAMVSGYDALKLQNVQARMLVLISDGGGSCTSLSSPMRQGYSDGACPDWEYPDSMNALIKMERTDPQTPINTFIVGLPGSDTVGKPPPADPTLNMSGSFETAPYAMQLALSTYAVSGSPNTVDPTCDSMAMFTPSGAPPAKPCHIDLSSGAFDPTKLAAAINQIRGVALGCTFGLPDPPAGQTIDPAEVNVEITQNGMTMTLPRRSNPTDMCATGGCWDYTSSGQVQLIGQACSDATSGVTTEVQIQVGCMTVLK